MSLVYNSKHKLRNVRRAIDAVLNGDMPFAAGRKALLRLLKAFEPLEKNLDRAVRLKDVDNITAVANNINVKILEVLPILGLNMCVIFG